MTEERDPRVHERWARFRFAAVGPLLAAPPEMAGLTALADRIFGEDDDELTAASNAVIDLGKTGKLDDAERAAHDLLERFPEVHDGHDRLGMVYEARGENRKAADCYRKVIAFVREHPDDYEPGFEDTFRRLVDRLDPTQDTSPENSS